MAFTSPYTTQAISGYNSSPPADDGSQVASNQVSWAKHKDKLADPLKTLAEGINTANVSAFAKTFNTDADVNNTMAGSISYTPSTLTLDTSTGMATATGTRAYHVISATAATGTLQVLSNTNYATGELTFLKGATGKVITISSTSTASGRFLRAGTLQEDRVTPFMLTGGAWAPLVGSSLEYISTTETTSGTSIDVTGLDQDGIAGFVLVLRNVRSTTQDRLLARFIGASSGAITSTGYIYRVSVEATTGNTYSGLNVTTPNAVSSARIQNANMATATDTAGANGIIFVPSNTSSLLKTCHFDLMSVQTATAVEGERNHGHFIHNTLAEAIDGIRLLFNGGDTFAGGAIDAYAVRR